MTTAVRRIVNRGQRGIRERSAYKCAESMGARGWHAGCSTVVRRPSRWPVSGDSAPDDIA
jgi:hypothetical protein